MTTATLSAPPSLAKFAALVQAHDLTFEYSDDRRWWFNGRAELLVIRALAKELPPEDVERIWNKNVDAKIGGSEADRQRWYWPGLTPESATESE